MAFALAILNPSAGNLGGGGYVYLSEKMKHFQLTIEKELPRSLMKKCFKIILEKLSKLSLNSILASGVPGTVSGMFYASKNYGTIDIESLIQPSIDSERRFCFV